MGGGRGWQANFSGSRGDLPPVPPLGETLIQENKKHVMYCLFGLHNHALVSSFELQSFWIQLLIWTYLLSLTSTFSLCINPCHLMLGQASWSNSVVRLMVIFESNSAMLNKYRMTEVSPRQLPQVGSGATK